MQPPVPGDLSLVVRCLEVESQAWEALLRRYQHLGLAATVWLTGGFHEDGLANTGDGLGATQQWAELVVYLVQAARTGTVA